MTSDAIVVGAGVIGLTSAIVLAESGRRVAVWSRDPIGDTTSAVAGGLWWPYRVEPEEKVGAWSVRTLGVLAELAARPGETGVRMVDGTLAGTGLGDLGPWAAEVPGLRPARREELPEGWGHGLRARVPVVDMPTYLGYLRRRLEAAGGTVEQRAVATLAEAAREAPLIVNCTGLGARDLVPDAEVRPVQGQLVLVENPGVDEWFVAADPGSADTLYVLPQPYGVILGGTAREDVWDLAPDPATAEAIVARCARVHPPLADARVIGHRVGLRPARSRVRLEADTAAGGVGFPWLLHNYGHGGAGITVAWGCAEEAAELVSSC
ncbi:putative D-amino acid oxidase [Streptomyces bingchenggensis BCW-1]|uniref:D-amino-acid oxidase n=1 Tax=Streptomyces bingchenggensis (strain BCW-1) TaxID=749414 RepID=D7C0N3_STRBB|nr:MULTISPECIES: FAD-dependent oxidoreductase [Streptomyces]ADI05755.1 putative D-amino acid oxidase [Streptomyces bingchenggensis BCW-1]